MDTSRASGAMRGLLLIAALLLAAALLTGCAPAAPASVAAPTAAVVPDTTPAIALMVMPDDGRAPVLNAIRAAHTSIRLTVYLLTDDAVVDELMRAHERGVDVRALVEPTPYGAVGGSRDDVAKLKAAGVEVRDSNPTFRYTHQKSLVVDDAVGLIMTLNLSPASFTTNREHGVIDTDPARVAEMARVFDADWQRRDVAVSHPDLVWSPANARPRLLPLLRSARTSLDVEAEVLTDETALRALAEVAARGVPVRVLLPPAEASDPTVDSVAGLAGRGAQVRRLDSPYPHTKLIIVDGARAYLGSVNLSANSLDNNRELGIVIDDPAALQRLKDSFAADWTRGY